MYRSPVSLEKKILGESASHESASSAAPVANHRPESTRRFTSLSPGSGAREVLLCPAPGDLSVDLDASALEEPLAVFGAVLVSVAAPVVEPRRCQDREVAATLRRAFVLEVDHQGRGVVPDG